MAVPQPSRSTRNGADNQNGQQQNGQQQNGQQDDIQNAAIATTMQYSASTIGRAERAVRCSPFYLKLLAAMRVTSVGVLAIAEDSGMLKGYTQQPLSEISAETELLWLAAVGILRREVDGQGLTDSFRLTPLGRLIVARWQSQGCPDRRASLVDYIQNAVARRLRLPDWLG